MIVKVNYELKLSLVKTHDDDEGYWSPAPMVKDATKIIDLNHLYENFNFYDGGYENYVVLGEAGIPIATFIMNLNTGEIENKVILPQEQIVESFNTEIDAFVKRKKAVSSLVSRYSRPNEENSDNMISKSYY